MQNSHFPELQKGKKSFACLHDQSHPRELESIMVRENVHSASKVRSRERKERGEMREKENGNKEKKEKNNMRREYDGQVKKGEGI